VQVDPDGEALEIPTMDDFNQLSHYVDEEIAKLQIGGETIETWQTLQGDVDYTILNKSITVNKNSGIYVLSDNQYNFTAEVDVVGGEKYALTLSAKQSTSAEFPTTQLVFTNGIDTQYLDPDTYGYDFFCGATSTSIVETITDYEVTVPNGATKMYVCPKNGAEKPIIKKWTTVEVEKEDVFVAVSPLYRKKVVFTGDSICDASTDETGVRGWAQRIGDKYSMNWTNAAKSGATITRGITTFDWCISDTDFGKNPDYIIIEGGTNDADYIGMGTDEVMPDNFGTYSVKNYGDFDNSTFCGAVEYMFKRVTTDYPGTKIGFIIPQKMGYYVGDGTNTTYDYSGTNTRRFYFDTIIELCKKWGIPYIDLWYGCYLSPMNAVHRTGDDPFFANDDGQHLTAKGYDYITPMIEKWMETL
jgi:lysophospholipase L1-like esterase